MAVLYEQLWYSLISWRWQPSTVLTFAKMKILYGFETAFLPLFLLFHLNYGVFFSVHPSSYFVSFQIKGNEKKTRIFVRYKRLFFMCDNKTFYFPSDECWFHNQFFFSHLFFLISVFSTIFAHLNNKIWDENKLHANFLSYPIILGITLHSTNLANTQTEKSRKISFIFLCYIYWYCVWVTF